MKATVEERFDCPYCKRGTHTVHAPLASTFPPHKGLRCHLSGQGDLPMCEDCPDQDPKPATVHCSACNSNRCAQCDTASHSPSMLSTILVACCTMIANLHKKLSELQHSTNAYPSSESLQRHRRVPLDQAGPQTMCPEHAQPVSAICECDGSLLCSGCHMQPGATHKGHGVTAVEHSAAQLAQKLATMLEGLLAQCRDIASAAVDWKGQATVAEFLSETQCALVEAQGEKIKTLVDSATAVACRQMRDSVARLKEEQLSALGKLSVASAETAVFAGKAKMALQTERPGALVACLSAVRLGTGTVLQSEKPAMSIDLQQHAVPTGSLIVSRCVHLGCSDSPNTQAII
eukprot:gene5027-biopygen4507